MEGEARESPLPYCTKLPPKKKGPHQMQQVNSVSNHSREKGRGVDAVVTMTIIWERNTTTTKGGKSGNCENGCPLEYSYQGEKKGAKG